MDFKIVIPSYKRSKIILDKVLNKVIFYHNLNEKYEVFIFIIPEEYNDYKYLEQYKNIKLILGNLGLRHQRNYIRDYFENECLWILDDDVIKINVANNNLENEIIKTFEYMQNNNLYICGVNPTGNLYFNECILKKGFYFCVGCCYFEINNKHKLLYLDDFIMLQDEKEDYIRTINHYKYNGLIGRNDCITFQHKFNKCLGGMNNDLTDEDKKTRQCVNNLSINLINGKYPNFTKIKQKKKGPELQIYNKVFYKIYVSKKQESNLSEYYDGYDYNKLCKDKNFLIYDKDSKNLLGIILRNVINTNILDNKFIKRIYSWTNYKNENRGDIAGKVDLNKIPKNAVKLFDKDKLNKTGSRVLCNNYQFSNSINCITLGYYTKNKLSQYDKKYEDIIQNNMVYFMEQLNNIYKNVYLDLFEETIPQKKYLDSFFSSITINKGLRSACHVDKNNKNYFALLFSTGMNYWGCDLLFPDYKLNLNLKKNKDILIFDSKNVKHCNSHFDKYGDNSQRLSWVFFSK